MEFRDFNDNPLELIGKLVLYTSGMSYSKQSLYIKEIEKVTKTGFKISGLEDKIFKLNDGHQKGLNGRMNMATISYCTLITNEEAEKYRAQWKRNKEIAALREEIKIKLDRLTLSQLTKIKEIINS